MTPLKEKIIKEFEKYWYHAGEWHLAECYLILDDQGVCNCKTSKNRKEILKALDSYREEIIKEIGEHIDEFMELQSTNRGFTEEDLITLEVGIGAFLMSYKLSHLKGDK